MTNQQRLARAIKQWQALPKKLRDHTAIGNLEVDGQDGHDCGLFFDPKTKPADCDCEDRSLAFRTAARLLRFAGQQPRKYKCK